MPLGILASNRINDPESMTRLSSAPKKAGDVFARFVVNHHTINAMSNPIEHLLTECLTLCQGAICVRLAFVLSFWGFWA
jgi:hypothetical protein